MDFTWVPSVESGLSGDAYPTEQIDPFIENFDDAKQPGVYILRLSRPETNDLRHHKQLWKQDHDHIPDYLEEITSTDSGILYVGATEHVLPRVEEHLDDRVNKSASIMDTYPPHSIVGMQFFENKETAFDHEHGIGMQLANKYSNMYVHFR